MEHLAHFAAAGLRIPDFLAVCADYWENAQFCARMKLSGWVVCDIYRFCRLSGS
jgi:hypothetical protein